MQSKILRPRWIVPMTKGQGRPGEEDSVVWQEALPERDCLRRESKNLRMLPSRDKLAE